MCVQEADLFAAPEEKGGKEQAATVAPEGSADVEGQRSGEAGAGTKTI